MSFPRRRTTRSRSVSCVGWDRSFSAIVMAVAQTYIPAYTKLVQASSQGIRRQAKHITAHHREQNTPSLPIKCTGFQRRVFTGSKLSTRTRTLGAGVKNSANVFRKLQVRALTIEQQVVTIQTKTGPMNTLVLKPTAPGKYPGILFYSEIFQVTGPIRRSAAMMACHGFVVIVPDIYHEDEAPGSYLDYDGPGADRGNALKIAKNMHDYDSDAEAATQFLLSHPACTGKLGTMGFCIGGHLAFRAAMHPDIIAAAVFYPTDIHKGSPKGLTPAGGGRMGFTCDTLKRVPEFAEDGTELLMIFGRQDPHIDRPGRKRILNSLMDADVCFTWHEFNGQHAFMRDEGYRYDGELAIECYTKSVNLFRRKLNVGDLPVPSSSVGTTSVESRH